MRNHALILFLLFAAPSHAQDTDTRFAETLVRVHYFEGLPFDEAQKLAPEGVARLIGMLEDPGEAEYHGNIVEALGISGDPRAFVALKRLSDRPASRELSLDEFRARLALPLAMGHLARTDPRALAILQADALHGTNVRWRYQHLSPQRMNGMLRRATITGLGMTGGPAANATLRQLEMSLSEDDPTEQALRQHVDEALRLHARVSRSGAKAVFGPDRVSTDPK